MVEALAYTISKVFILSYPILSFLKWSDKKEEGQTNYTIPQFIQANSKQ